MMQGDKKADAGEAPSTLVPILDYLVEKRGFDFTGYHPDMLARRISKRLFATGCKDFTAYLARLNRDADEVDQLVEVLTIHVSRFFRDALTFELIAERILPALIREKAIGDPASLRIWSAGCARGEEPYSVAILLHELQEKEAHPITFHFFATDIDAGALQDARRACYPLTSVEEIRHRLLMKYFTPEGAMFRLIPEIKDKVLFSLYDMLDKKHRAPPESVFGGFDLVLCRNLLIYFNPEYQVRIFEKLYHALATDGYLVLGEAETPPPSLRHLFNQAFESSPIYRKRRKA